MRVLETPDEVLAAVGEDLGSSDWLEITQGRVDAFAAATGDDQWIHVDVERARSGPFGGTVAHGYLTLSLVPMLGTQVFRLGGSGARLNYGTNKVRFPAPLRVGRRVRSHVRLAEATAVPAGLQVVFRHTVEIEGEDKPACVAETVVLVLA